MNWGKRTAAASREEDGTRARVSAVDRPFQRTCVQVRKLGRGGSALTKKDPRAVTDARPTTPPRIAARAFESVPIFAGTVVSRGSVLQRADTARGGLDIFPSPLNGKFWPAINIARSIGAA